MSVLDRQMSATAKIFPHPLNAWYVAAWDYEVTNKRPLARTIAKRPLAMYRTADGRPVALSDACWHRLGPLSMGKLIGKDEIQCPYHGLRYNASGRCTAMPAQETINPSAMVPSFPVVERYRYVWVWLGDVTLADPDLIPDMFQMDSPEWAGDGLTIPAECNYQLVLDNLMDLTHEEFVHGSSIGQAELSESEFTVTHDQNTVTVTRWMRDVPPPPFWLKNMRDKFPGFTGNVDRWQIIHYQAPSTIRIDVGVAKAGTGAPDGDRSQGVNGFVMNTITPESDRANLPLLLGVHAQLLPGQPADHDAVAAGRGKRLRRGRGDAHRPAAGDRREPRLRVLQPERRRRRHVGTADPRPDAGRREPFGSRPGRFPDRNRRARSRTGQRRSGPHLHPGGLTRWLPTTDPTGSWRP